MAVRTIVSVACLASLTSAFLAPVCPRGKSERCKGVVMMFKPKIPTTTINNPTPPLSPPLLFNAVAYSSSRVSTDRHEVDVWTGRSIITLPLFALSCHHYHTLPLSFNHPSITITHNVRLLPPFLPTLPTELCRCLLNPQYKLLGRKTRPGRFLKLIASLFVRTSR